MQDEVKVKKHKLPLSGADAAVLKQRVWELMRIKGVQEVQEAKNTKKRVRPATIYRTWRFLLEAGPARGAPTVWLSAKEIQVGKQMEVLTKNDPDKKIQIQATNSSPTTIGNIIRILEEWGWIKKQKINQKSLIGFTMDLELIEIELHIEGVPEYGTPAYDRLTEAPVPAAKQREKRNTTTISKTKKARTRAKQKAAKEKAPVQNALKLNRQAPIDLPPIPPEQMRPNATILVDEPAKEEDLEYSRLEMHLDLIKDTVRDMRTSMVEKFLAYGEKGCPYSNEQLGRCVRMRMELGDLLEYVQACKDGNLSSDEQQ